MINNEQKSQWIYLDKSCLYGSPFSYLSTKKSPSGWIYGNINSSFTTFGWGGKTVIQKGKCYGKAGMWHFCSHFLIIHFKIIIWVGNSQMLGLLLKNQKSILQNYTKNKPFKIQRICGKGASKTPVIFFLKDIWENKFLIYSIRFPQPKSFRGGKLDENALNFL